MRIRFGLYMAQHMFRRMIFRSACAVMQLVTHTHIYIYTTDLQVIYLRSLKIMLQLTVSWSKTLRNANGKCA